MKTMDKIEWFSEKRKVADLKPYPGNPRQSNEKQEQDLEQSLDRFNLAEPLVVNIDGTVIGGNFRLRLLLKKGVEEIDVRVPNRELSKEEADELNLRLNKNQGMWDTDLLKEFGENMIGDVGFSSDEMDDIFGLETIDDFNVENEIEKLEKEGEIRTAAGQLWVMGDHRLIIGDATDRTMWERLLGKERFDFMFTDPPYRLAYKKGVRKVKTKEGFKLRKDQVYDSVGKTNKRGKPDFAFGAKSNRSYQGLEIKGGVPEFDEWLSIAKSFEKSTGANIMVFESWKNVRELWNAVEKYWKVMNMIVWHTPNRMQRWTSSNALYSKYDIAIAGESEGAGTNDDPEEELDEYLQLKGQKLIDSYDLAIYGTSGKRTRTANMEKSAKIKWGRLTDHVTANVGSTAESGQNLIFGTKPVQILVGYLKVLSPKGGAIMEPFGGSGSTIIASEIMKRRCFAIELSPLYAEVIIRRWEKFTGRIAEKIDGGNG